MQRAGAVAQDHAGWGADDERFRHFPACFTREVDVDADVLFGEQFFRFVALFDDKDTKVTKDTKAAVNTRLRSTAFLLAKPDDRL